MKTYGRAKAGRPPTARREDRKVNPTLPANVMRRLEVLAEMSLYGPTKTEVAAYLIRRGVDDLIRNGVLRLPIGGEGTA